MVGSIPRLTWPNKYLGVKWTAGATWTNELNGATITDKGFTVLSGAVTLTSPAISGDITYCTVEGGAAGLAEVLCEATLSDGSILQAIAEFFILDPTA